MTLLVDIHSRLLQAARRDRRGQNLVLPGQLRLDQCQRRDQQLGQGCLPVLLGAKAIRQFLAESKLQVLPFPGAPAGSARQ
ncbi:hypothetical protein SNE32_08640 [Lysobacter sp. D1-1-M9]|uniref:hypothetical protein n=1 Tax=Novilysobacter longmucuonensis TaxID=3098603 RepID=UPI002FC76A9E